MEIRNLMETGVSVSEISRMLGVDRRTVKKYAGLDQYHPFFRELRKTSKLEPYKEYIKARLEKFPLSAVRIMEEIQLQGYLGKISILRDFMRELRHNKTYHAVKTFETALGQQGQIDWAYFGNMLVDGKEIGLYCFLMVLGYSRQRYIEFTNSMDIYTLIKCHINAYKYFEGAPHENLYDNMKQVVLRRGKTVAESQLHPLFSDFMAYYGTTISLCRVRKPRTKGKVERPVFYVRDNFFLGLEFSSLEDLNMKAMAWLDKVNSKVHSSTKEAPSERLKKEQPLLIQTAGRPDYKISEVLYRKARSNCLVSVHSGEYSVPPKYANREVEVRVDGEWLSISYRGEEIARHKLVAKGCTSFIDAHRQQLEEGCYYFPKQNKFRRNVLQIAVQEQAVDIRNLNSYEEG